MPNPRIEELRRRVDKDPASIAFAQLAEELRRAGDFDEAIRVCRTGLEQHPAYLSARVTLGRALLETGLYDEAQTELEEVVRSAPDNLAAIRALADIHQRREESGVITPSADPIAEQPLNLPAADLDLAFGTLDDAPLDAPLDDSFEAPMVSEHVVAAEEPIVAEAHAPEDPALAELEGWLAAIVADRKTRATGA